MRCKAWTEANREKRQAYITAWHRRRKGFTPELIEALKAAQGGVCAICTVQLSGGKHPQRMTCDHCHDANVPRGLLCDVCNTCLGRYEKYQRPAGLRISAYESYLLEPPATKVDGRLGVTRVEMPESL